MTMSDDEDLRSFERRYVTVASEWDAAQRMPDEPIARCADRGFFGANIPKIHGGGGLGNVALGPIFEALGAVSGSLGSIVNVQHMVTHALLRGATDAQKEEWLPRLASGRDIASFCITEPNVGSDIAAIETTCERAGTGLRLRGTKRWITTASRASVYLVFGKLEGAPVACIVPRDTPGLTVTPIDDLLGLRSAHLGLLEIDCELPNTA